MIGSLEGRIEEIVGDTVTINVNGVGYEVTCSRKLFSRLDMGQASRFLVYTDVREDQIRLFGFDDRPERQIFLLLNKVNGVGPRLALDILSQVDKRDLLRAIGAGDLQTLTAVKGVGRKRAERMVVELKDIVTTFSADLPAGLSSKVEMESIQSEIGSEGRDAAAALEVLGFSRKDAEKAVKEALSSIKGEINSGDLVREALRFV